MHLNYWQASSSLGMLVHREFKAIAGAVTISCLMVCSMCISECTAKRMQLFSKVLKTLDARRMLAYGLEFFVIKRRLNMIKHVL